MNTRLSAKGFGPRKNHHHISDGGANVADGQGQHEQLRESLNGSFSHAQARAFIDEFSLTIPTDESSEMDLEDLEPSSPSCRHSIRGNTYVFRRSAGAPPPSSPVGRRSKSAAIKSESTEDDGDEIAEEHGVLKLEASDNDDEGVGKAFEVLTGIIERKKSKIHKLEMEVEQLEKILELAGGPGDQHF
ncbi:hypothetical protein ABW21_db0202164 [Orbilia brochopaga]|nr:hypothetical protein ABW21_db0202164 [Drechslerella brochopaga]